MNYLLFKLNILKLSNMDLNLFTITLWSYPPRKQKENLSFFLIKITSFCLFHILVHVMFFYYVKSGFKQIKLPNKSWWWSLNFQLWKTKNNQFLISKCYWIFLGQVNSAVGVGDRGVWLATPSVVSPCWICLRSIGYRWYAALLYCFVINYGYLRMNIY